MVPTPSGKSMYLANYEVRFFRALCWKGLASIEIKKYNHDRNNEILSVVS